MATRLFLIGVITLYFGAQLRAVDTFVLTEKVTSAINRRLRQPSTVVQTHEAGLYDPLLTQPVSAATAAPVNLPKKRQISPPRWMGWSFLSIGTILVLTAPLFRH